MDLLDPLAAVLDEVALEGLDGITIETLWLRLENRQEFGLTLDQLTRRFIWTSVSRAAEIRFYLLPEPRGPVTLHDRFVLVDRSTGIHEMLQTEPDDDVYPVSVVVEPDGPQGSCVFYKERKELTECVRSADLRPLLQLEEAQSRWGECLVMVASQELRYRALVGPEGNLELRLPDQSYCILERLGRARWQGELQRDLHTRVFKMDAGKMHYVRRKLDRNGLITLQSHVARLPTGAQQYSLLLLLKRFHVDRRSKYDILMEAASNILSDLPDKIGQMQKVREQLRVSERTFKRVYQYMTAAKMASVVRIPLRELDPTGGPHKTIRGTDVFVRCLKLLKPYGQKEPEEDEEEEDEEAEAKRSVAEPRVIERDMITQAYNIVVSVGTRGISQSALRGRLNIGRLEGRMVCRLLERNNMITGFMEDEGRQRTTKYISKLFVEQSKLNQQFTKEWQRSQHLRTTHLTEPEAGAAAHSQPEPHIYHNPRQRKPAKPSSSEKAPPPKKKTSERVGGAKASKKTETGKKKSQTVSHTPSTSQSQPSKHTQPVVEEVLIEKTKKAEVHETYRLLKRKNMILETVCSNKIIEGFYSLQKLLTDEEKKDGVSTKVCKKSVVRLIKTLSREGLLKLYRTIVIQDGVQKKVEFVVHPSVTPDDPLVKSAIQQIRMRMSSSASTPRVEPQKEKVKPAVQEVKQNKPPASSRASQSSIKKVSEKMGVKTLKSFRPVLVPGFGRSMGFQPKMPRLRIVHSFLWYLIYGHPNRSSVPTNLLPEPETKEEDTCGDEGQFRVYANENTWKRYIPPIPLHKDFGHGWALISDVLVSLPLSILLQVVQINYEVEGLEQYLQDPVKRHYLIRFLPAEVKRQLLHRRKYVFSFHESLQRLCFMGLLHFGPTEKFMDKDQVFVYLKTKATIADTTVCEPHYHLALEGARPFERRHYQFSSAQHVENYWFDLLCVCLNSPLGVIRPRSGEGGAEGQESEVMTMERNPRMQAVLQGSCDVVDDGVTPGDGQGAGGLDSSFFGHLKRNWSWTSHLITPIKQSTDDAGAQQTVRLRNLLTKHPLPKPAVNTVEVKVSPPAVLEEQVRISSEPSSRIQQHSGGRNLKRKRQKKEKPPRKKRRVRVQRQRQAQDETDQRALLHMTRQRVAWTHTEDSLLMLCRVASNFLNRKLKRPFVPWTVVRDILHAEFDSSQDKTSLAVGRRSRYIMKNPQTCLNYRICLAEMYQDKELISRFSSRTGDYNDLQVCALEYKEFVSALRSKFSSSYGPSDVIIPDTRQQLFDRFKVYAVGDDSLQRTQDVLKKQEDIDVLVLFNLIQSTLVLTNAQMKNYRPFQTFCLYSRYREKVLSQAFQTCRSRALVNRRRPMSFHGLKKCHSLPFLPMSYQLSQHYYKFFTWRFPTTMYNEAFDLMVALYEQGRSNTPSRFSFQTEPGDQAQPENRCLSPELLQFPIDAPGGATACCLTLMTLGLLSVDVSIPQQIVVVDSSLMDNEVVKSLTKALEEEDEEEDDDRRRKLEVKPTQASHTNYLLMRGYYTHGILRSQTHNSNSTDNIMVNTCSVRLQLRETAQHTLFTADADFALSPSIRPSLPLYFTRVYHSPPVDWQSFLDKCVSVCGYGEQDLQAVVEIRDAVAEGAEFGVDRQELCERFIHLDEVEEGRSRALVQYIQDLVDGEQLVEVGALSQRLVVMEAASHWLLESERYSEETQQPLAKRGSSSDSAHVTPPPAKRRALDADFQKAGVSTDNIVNPTVAMDTVSTSTPINQTVAIDTICTETNVSQTVAVDTVSTEKAASLTITVDTVSTKSDALDTVSTKTAVSQTVTMDTVSTDTAVGQIVAMDTLSKNTGVSQAVTMDTDAETAVGVSGASDQCVSDTSRAELSEDIKKDGAADQQEAGSLRFVSRPWRVVDGSLNRPVCKGMLESLLLHIMSSPALHEAQLLQHYSQVLQPTVVLELLQVLVDLGCVRKRLIVPPRRVSLFSRPQGPQLKDPAEERVSVRVRDAAVVFYEPTVDCVLRLARVFPHELNWNKWVQLCMRVCE